MGENKREKQWSCLERKKGGDEGESMEVKKDIRNLQLQKKY
jgi:hypothetical protein